MRPNSGYTNISEKTKERIVKFSRFIFLVAIVGYLLYKMSDIGWAQIIHSLPTSVLFYLIFGILYFSLPVTEAFIYKYTWKFSAVKYLPVFIKKRVYNKDVLGYSGEVYLYTWARKTFDIPDRKILETIRDNNILSSIASTSIAVILLTVFASLGKINVYTILGEQNIVYVLIGIMGTIVLALLAVKFRRNLFSMTWRVSLTILTAHTVRLLIGNGLQIMMWAVAIPQIELSVWLTFAVASIIVSRIPFVPNRDLIMLGAGIELAEMMDLSSASITGLFITLSVLGKLSNLIWFVVISALDKRSGISEPSIDGKAVETTERKRGGLEKFPNENPYTEVIEDSK